MVRKEKLSWLFCNLISGFAEAGRMAWFANGEELVLVEHGRAVSDEAADKGFLVGLLELAWLPSLVC